MATRTDAGRFVACDSRFPDSVRALHSPGAGCQPASGKAQGQERRRRGSLRAPPARSVGLVWAERGWDRRGRYGLPGACVMEELELELKQLIVEVLVLKDVRPSDIESD